MGGHQPGVGDLGCTQNALTDMVAVSDTRVRITIPVLNAHQVQQGPNQEDWTPFGFVILGPVCSLPFGESLSLSQLCVSGGPSFMVMDVR